MALKSKIPPGKKILLFLVEVYGFVFISLKTKESLSPPKGKYVGRFFDRRNSKHLTLKSKILMENINKNSLLWLTNFAIHIKTLNYYRKTDKL